MISSMHGSRVRVPTYDVTNTLLSEEERREWVGKFGVLMIWHAIVDFCQ